MTLVFLSSLTSSFYGQSFIRGQVFLDSTWEPTAYLCEIPDFSKVNKMSAPMIIDQAEIGPDGIYQFDIDYLPEEDRFYRIHFTKLEDPPASLIIGGRNENHFFLFANNNAQIEIYSGLGDKLFNNLSFSGFYPNDLLNDLLIILKDKVSSNQIISAIKRDAAIESNRRSLRGFADTCSHPLLALYGLYSLDFEEDLESNSRYYKRFLKKWKNEDSAYFTNFRKQISKGRLLGIILLIFLTTSLLVFLSIYWYQKRKIDQKVSILEDLTIQERKIFGLILNHRSNKEIAEECFIGINTVKSHVYNIYSKLNVSSRKDLIDRFS